MKRTPLPLLAVAAFAAALLPAAALATNGARPIASGPRAGGRGGADTAVADDATAINTNPAGLAFIDGQRFDAFLAAVRPTVKWKNPVDSVTSERPGPGAILAGPFFATAFDFDEPWRLGEALTFGEETPSELAPRTTPEYAGSGWKFGLGVFALSGNFIDFDAKSPFFNTQRMDWETDLKEVGLGLALAYRISPRLAFGFAPQFIYSQLENDQVVTQPTSVLEGHPTNNDGPGVGTDPTYADFSPFLGVDHIEGFSDFDGASTFGFRARLGLMFLPMQWDGGQLALGLSYASPTFKQDYLGEATIDMSKQMEDLSATQQGAVLKPTIRANTGIPENEQTYVGKYNLRLRPLDFPQEVSAGGALTLLAGDSVVVLAADVTWLGWSQTFKRVEVKLSDGESVELNELTGDGSGDTTLTTPLDWEDQVVLAMGVSVSPADWLVLRAGYNYGNNPVPDDTVQPTAPAISEHHASLGATFLIRRAELTLTYEHTFENTVRVARSRSNPDVDGSEISVAIDALAVGFSMRF